MPGKVRFLLTALLAVLASAAITPAAWAAAPTPILTLDQSAGTQAGATEDLGTDLKFTSDGSDTPKDLTLSLPPGLLADAAINGGKCLSEQPASTNGSAQPDSACQVGSGTVTALAQVAPGLPLPPVSQSLPISLYLVAPPASGDLAGLEIYTTGAAGGLLGAGDLGTPGAVAVRPVDAGINVAFKNVPNTFSGFSIAVTELQTTLTGLRMPTNCTSPHTFTATTVYYTDPSPKSSSASLRVTGCNKLDLSAAFAVTATPDSGDNGVEVTTDLTQPAAPPAGTGAAAEAAAGQVVLTLPSTVLGPNPSALGSLCTDPTFASCTPVGTATSTSPLYSKILQGKVYLTGSVTNLGLAMVFPAPFPITLTGAVNLATNSTAFTGIPDLPLTDLKVDLGGGADSVFTANCAKGPGTATAQLTSQNGDQTVTPSTSVTATGCPPPKPPSGGGGGSGGGSSGGGTSGGGGSNGGPTPAPKPTPGPPRLASASLRGLIRGAAALRFKLVAGSHAPGIKSFSVRLPGGLAFVTRRVHGRLHIAGVSLNAGKINSMKLVRGHLVLTLAGPVNTATVNVRSLHEGTRFARRASRHHLGTLRLSIVVRNAAGKATTVRRSIHHR